MSSPSPVKPDPTAQRISMSALALFSVPVP
jgi:hypothetical protein